jgi:phosphate transport system protein
MTHIETELQRLKKDIMVMGRLVSGQMKKAMRMLADMDKAMAADILVQEKNVNSMEVEMDRRCEDIIALYNPVAIDLRLVLALLRINNSIERIGDVAASIARFVRRSKSDDIAGLLDKTHALGMFEEAADLINDALNAFEKEDTELAKSIFRRDQALNDLNRSAKKSIIEHIKQDPESVEVCLDILSVIRKLERAGDQSKSIAHEVVFYIEAIVSKHEGKGAPDAD